LCRFKCHLSDTWVSGDSTNDGESALNSLSGLGMNYMYFRKHKLYNKKMIT